MLSRPPRDPSRRSSRRAPRSEALIAAAVLAVVVTSAPGQRQLEDLRKRGLPPGNGFALAVASGDVDGDGDLDIVLGNMYGGQDQLYLNDGSGVYTDATAGRMPADTDYTSAVALGDVDGDGDLDIVLANSGVTSIPYTIGQQNRLYLNNGAGVFTDATSTHMPADGDFTQEVALGDIDGDGDLDMVLANRGLAYSFYVYGQQNRLYLNDGLGHYTDATSTRMPAESDCTTAVALGDVDADGDLDIVFGNGVPDFFTIQQSTLYLNDGTGRYTDVTAARLPAHKDVTYGLALGDVDGDGDTDIVLANYREQNRLWLNDGSGTYTDRTAARLPARSDATNAAALGDVDADGDLDVIFGNELERSLLLLNDGTGTYTDAPASRLPAYREFTRAVAMLDVEGDGDLDVVLGNSGQSRLWLNDGGGSYADATAAHLPPDVETTSAVVLGDVDGDGDLDLVAARKYGTQGSGQNRLYLNDGTGTFGDATEARMPILDDSTGAAAIGDVDGDGDLDIVFGNFGKQNRLYQNDGTGRYTDVTAARMPTDSDYTAAVALGDVDGDGDLDIVFGTAYQGTSQGHNRLYLNDGTGTFTVATTHHLPTVNVTTLAVVLGDVDVDGDLDLVCGNRGGTIGAQNRLYLNDGRGFFTDATTARMPVGIDVTQAVAMGDVDGDGDLDLVFGNSVQNTLLVNNGLGAFKDVTAAQLPALRGWTGGLGLGDIDGDGDLDLMCGNSYYRGSWQNQLWLNDGLGTFTDVTATRLPEDLDSTMAVALGDVDGDGDTDVVLGTARGPDRVYLNLVHQLAAPLTLRVGHGYPLQAYARYAPGSGGAVVLPLLAPATARNPVPPFGTFGLDPSQTVAAPPFVLSPTGTGQITLSVPNVPALAGRSVFAQALLVPSPFPALLTNVTGDVVVR